MSVEIIILPRAHMSWDDFCRESTPKSIALDGMVDGGPRWDEKTLRANFDHHSDVVREATMSTSMQVMFAIKGGIMARLGGEAKAWINDPDQDTSLATWLLSRHHLFDGVQSHPAINRLLALTDRLDITGGSYPMRIDDDVLSMHEWVFEPYNELRASGALASADSASMRNCIDAVHARLNRVLVGQAGHRLVKIPSVIYESPYGFSVIDERETGNAARSVLFSKGMNAFVSIVAQRTDGAYVYSIGRRSRYVNFPLQDLYRLLGEGWGGSDIIGGSPRLAGSRMAWQQIRDVLEVGLSQLI